MYRLLFEKKGRAVWISHLDLMRLFQRAFKRAGYSLTHSHGFNPRPSVSIALPLSVGVASNCELLDFSLDAESPSCEEIQNKLNSVLVDGIKVRNVYSDGRKIRDIAFLQCQIILQYDAALNTADLNAVKDLFESSEVFVEKKSKNGTQDINIIPMIRKISFTGDTDHIYIDATVCCQNPSLNPMLIISAIDRNLPQLTPSHYQCIRTEIYDCNDNIFR